MSELNPKRLLLPEVRADAVPKIKKWLSLRICSSIPDCQWEANLWTVMHSYGLWVIFWINFITTLSHLSYRGENLWIYVYQASPFDLTIPELFLFFSIALSLFAVIGVFHSSWQAPRIWKRLLMVSIFAGIAIGFAILVQWLRHYSYQQAVAHRSGYPLEMSFYRFMEGADREWELKRVRLIREEREKMIRHYEERYGIQPR